MHKLLRITTVPVSLLVLLREQLKFMSDHYEVLAVSSEGEALKQVALQTGVRTEAVSMTRKITPLKDLMALWKLYQLIRREKPLMVHTHTPKAGLLGMMAAQLAGVPVRLHTVAGMPLLEKQGITRKILTYAEKLTYWCATRVYPNSQKMKEIIVLQRYCRPYKLKVIGNGSSNGVDTAFFANNHLPGHDNELKTSLKISAEDTVYCFIGRIVTDKGICELVQAFINICEKYPHSKLLLVGPFERDLDPLDHFIEHQILNHPSIIWVDFKNDVRPYFRISNIFVFPSYREGFPNVVMQAGAMGLPCIVSNINGCNEIIEDGKNGIIIPAKDARSLQMAMEKLALDKALRERMASVSRQMIVNRYDQEFIMNELLKEYNLLSEKSSIR
ncbi:MAG TPA: glycosyltransferase family 4 protein [Daejeonella sp.]|nr:glycosyltransferase family 4 protein [Daejeonella sp.]